MDQGQDTGYQDTEYQLTDEIWWHLITATVQTPTLVSYLEFEKSCKDKYFYQVGIALLLTTE